MNDEEDTLENIDLVATIASNHHSNFHFCVNLPTTTCVPLNSIEQEWLVFHSRLHERTSCTGGTRDGGEKSQAQDAENGVQDKEREGE